MTRRNKAHEGTPIRSSGRQERQQRLLERGMGTPRIAEVVKIYDTFAKYAVTHGIATETKYAVGGNESE